MGKQKKQTKSKRGRRSNLPSSSDMAVSAGRGRSVPRASLGSDTLLGLAQSQRRTLALSYNVIPAMTSGGYGEQTILLNSAYQPFAATSAIGYAKYMAFYSKCFVVGATLQLKGVVVDNASTSGVATGVTISTNATSFATASAAIENGMCSWDVVFNIPDRIHFTQSVDVKKFLNKPNVLDDPQLYSTATAPPGQLIDAHVWAACLTGTTNVTVQYLFEVLYDCIFTDPIPFT